jgi:hypothetical protein
LQVGSIPLLKIRDLKHHENYKLYQVTFYENTKEEYFSFTTPECANYISMYLSFRERSVEKLKPESPLIRDDFIIDDLLHMENPKHITIDLLIFYLYTILKKTGIRKKNNNQPQPQQEQEQKNNRYPRNRQIVPQNHGFRKYTHTTMANARISPEIREFLVYRPR